MANPEHFEILKQGVDTWNKWRKNNPGVKPDLSELDSRNPIFYKPNCEEDGIFGAEFEGIDFSYVSLRNADLCGANLCKAYLYHADLREADLTYANLSKADLECADLSGADLGQAELLKTDLSEAKLVETRLVWATLKWAYLSYADLTKADIIESNLFGANLGSALLIDACIRGSKLGGVDLTLADLTGVLIEKTAIAGAKLIRTNLTNATLKECSIYSLSAWDINLKNTTQQILYANPPEQPSIIVSSIEIAQFIYLLLDHKKLREVLNTVTEKCVLLLGRFNNGGLELLQSIASKLRKVDYMPIIFDFDRPDNKNYTETVNTLVGLSRFVIVDLSGSSVPQELYSTVPHFKIPFVPIIEEGRKTYAMFADLLEYPWVLPPVRFSSQEQLLELLPSRVIEPAEEKFKERQALLERMFSK